MCHGLQSTFGSKFEARSEKIIKQAFHDNSDENPEEDEHFIIHMLKVFGIRTGNLYHASVSSTSARCQLLLGAEGTFPL